MTDREALEYIRKGLTVNRFSPKWQKALELACNALEEVMLNTAEKPVRTVCDERKEGKWATISVEDVESLNWRFYERSGLFTLIGEKESLKDLLAVYGLMLVRIKEVLEEEGLWRP